MDSGSKDLEPGQTLFRIHGPDGDQNKMLSASLFANKLAMLVRALKEADRIANGEHWHDYRIENLKSSSPTVMLRECLSSKRKDKLFEKSGIKTLQDCANAIMAGEEKQAQEFGNCPKYIDKLAQGASKSYGYGELHVSNDNIIRIDPFLRERTQAVIRPESYRPQIEDADWYKGIVEGSFDGSIKAVDLRGRLPEIMLILTAGNKKIDCVCTENDVESIRKNLDRRVRIFGRAIYDGRSGLPRRIEVRQIEPVANETDFTTWRGKFDTFDPPEWETDDA